MDKFVFLGLDGIKALELTFNMEEISEKDIPSLRVQTDQGSLLGEDQDLLCECKIHVTARVII